MPLQQRAPIPDDAMATTARETAVIKRYETQIHKLFSLLLATSFLSTQTFFATARDLILTTKTFFATARDLILTTQTFFATPPDLILTTQTFFAIQTS